MSKSVKQIFSLTLYAFFSVLVLGMPSVVSESVANSVQRCVQSLLPGIFPMMILSRQISGLVVIPKGRFSAMLSKLTGFSYSLLPVFFSGILCGYPVPAIICKSKKDLGLISEKEAEFATALTNGSSPGFLIFFVGNHLAKSVRTGVLLYLCQIAATVISAHIIGCPLSEKSITHYSRVSLSETVKSSAVSFIELCGFVTFFSVLSACISKSLHALSVPYVIAEALAGIFEITGFVEQLSPFSVSDCFLLCLFCASGGISVSFQVAAVMKDSGFSFIRFFLTRLLVGTVMAVLFLFFV